MTMGEQREAVALRLAAEIGLEREKKRRLEWYLSEVMKEKEQLMRENSQWLKHMDNVIAGTGQPQPNYSTCSVESPRASFCAGVSYCTDVDVASPGQFREGSTSSSPSLSSQCTSPTPTPELLEEELCCGSAPSMKVEPASESDELLKRALSQSFNLAEVDSFLLLDRPSTLDEPLKAVPASTWLIDEPSSFLSNVGTSECKMGLSCAQALESCLDLEFTSWLAPTDEQDLFSTLQEYFSEA